MSDFIWCGIIQHKRTEERIAEKLFYEKEDAKNFVIERYSNIEIGPQNLADVSPKLFQQNDKGELVFEMGDFVAKIQRKRIY